jgi:hypothetical protein
MVSIFFKKAVVLFYFETIALIFQKFPVIFLEYQGKEIF